MARTGSASPHRSRICKGCWEQMRMPVPLRGILSLPFQAIGIRASRMNPNTCTVCELMFEKVMRARKITIDATIMFADLRDYTKLSRSLSPDAMAEVLDAFYDDCSSAIWRRDGLLNKTLGDAVMAVFNFPIRQEDHAKQAVLAAREIQTRFNAKRNELGERIGLEGDELGVGIGLHTGQLSFGEFGRSHRDLTAIGTVVNIAARAQSVAAPGQILVTQAIHDAARPDMPSSPPGEYALKGLDDPLELYAA